MSLKEHDLIDTVLSKISIDEFEPKTGDAKDVLVMGFYVTEDSVGYDLYKFLSGSIMEVRDLEVSPNPNEDGYFMVFVEMDRNEKAVEQIKSFVDEAERVAGKLNWKARTYLNDDYLPLSEDEIYQYIVTDPAKYVTREEFEANKAEEERVAAEEARLAEEAKIAEDNSNSILAFLRPTNLLQAGINNGKLNMQDARNVLSLELVDFGEGKEILSKYGIAESAIKTDFDRTLFDKLRGMLGEMKALPIDQYVVIYNPADQSKVLLTKNI